MSVVAYAIAKFERLIQLTSMSLTAAAVADIRGSRRPLPVIHVLSSNGPKNEAKQRGLRGYGRDPTCFA